MMYEILMNNILAKKNNFVVMYNLVVKQLHQHFEQNCKKKCCIKPIQILAIIKN